MVESLGAIIPPEVPVVGGAAVLPTGAFGGVLFCAGAVVSTVGRRGQSVPVLRLNQTRSYSAPLTIGR
jgi:hypothetical protein